MERRYFVGSVWGRRAFINCGEVNVCSTCPAKGVFCEPSWQQAIISIDKLEEVRAEGKEVNNNCGEEILETVIEVSRREG